MKKRRIYIASSWKNKEAVRMLAKVLREDGHEVDDFTDANKRVTFTWEDLPGVKRMDLNAITFLEIPKSQQAFKEDKNWLYWADTCVLLLPAGNSAHIEAGNISGQGKDLFIMGMFPPGEFDLMYGFAEDEVPGDRLYRDATELREALKEGK